MPHVTREIRWTVPQWELRLYLAVGLAVAILVPMLAGVWLENDRRYEDCLELGGEPTFCQEVFSR